MIPQRVKLAGFLSYKEEQEILFQGASVWMLSGTNGSGKSSIFDAVTYALFGYHRGGSQNASELINKESNALSIEFDFLLDKLLHRIKRTIKRSSKGNTSSTQQIFQKSGPDDDDWTAVPDTNKKVDFDNWIHEHIGLNYETFTSSVLLLQGKAEKLLDSKPSGRAEVLAGIVDLERYQRLHEKANQRKLALKGQLEALTHQTAAVPEVNDFEYAAALEAIDRAEDDRVQTQKQLDSLFELEGEARKWTDVQTRLLTAREKLKSSESLLGSAIKIVASYTRLTELKAVIPAVQAVVMTRSKLMESDTRTQRLQKEREEAAERFQMAKNGLETAKKKRDTLKKQLETNEKNFTTTSTRLRELTAILQTVEHAESQQSRVKQLEAELAKFASDPVAELKKAQHELERLQDLARLMPVLQRVHDERHELAEATKKQTAFEKKAADIKARGELKRDEAKIISEKLAAAKLARTQADEKATGSAVLLQQAQRELQEFDSLSGKPNCIACGQPLTKKHFEEEKKKRAENEQSLKKQHEAAIAAQKAAKANEAQLLTADEDAKQQLEKLREEYKDADAERKQGKADETRLLKSLKLVYAELPAEFAKRISPSEPKDWGATKFPQRDELSTLNQEVAGLEAAKRNVRTLTDTQDRWKQTRTELASANQMLTSLQKSIPNGDITTLRQQFGSLSTEETSLTSTITANKRNLEMVGTEIDKLSREEHAATTFLTELRGKLETEEVSQKHHREVIERETSKLPAEWQTLVAKAGLKDFGVWKGELDELLAQDIEATYQKLELARVGLDTMRKDIAAIEKEEAAIPEASRCKPEDVRARINDTRKELENKDKSLREAQRQKSIFDGHREQRAKLGEQFKLIDGEHNRFKILSELLGRDRLQRHLVRQAERQIVDYANSVLDRLSGGQLFLRLIGGEEGAGTDRALDLECSNRITGGSPINVLFLSGSQKFRVAVSLALGIGQYASRQHRPIESVIIDEGFGCLDRQGRQVMIQELQNLRGHLHCIMLVSHQEEFADAFSDGYRFELQNGATRVSRFQK